MKIGIYTPYLDSFGGGERYVLSVAETLSKKHRVDLLIDQHQKEMGADSLKQDLARHLNLDLSEVQLISAPIGKRSSFIKRTFFLKSYDLIFYVTDGSIFYSTAKHNLIHFQVPFKNTIKGFWGKLKLSSWNLAVCNSEFTQGYIDKEWPLKTIVLYPPAEMEKIKPLKKQKYILSVGRFNSFNRSKKHEEMITAFNLMYQNGQIKDWSLHLAGSVEGDNDYIDELKKLSGKSPIFFYPNYPFQDLVKLYGQSSIYWHAAGLGEDDPAKMEHFGISTVEAMAAGCVPIVINKGGQPEIVENNISGLLWQNPGELTELTLRVINNPKEMKQLSEGAIHRSRLFSRENFNHQVNELVDRL